MRRMHPSLATGLDRRHFLLASGALAVAAGLAGCSSQDDSRPAGESKLGGGKQPQRGGTLRYAAIGGLPGFDPARWWNGFTWDGTIAVTESLLVSDGVRLLPGIADLPEVSADGTVYTFKLRSNVVFHHGRKLTADDAKFSLDRLMLPSTASEGISLFNQLPIVGLDDVLNERADSVRGITAPNSTTLRIQLERPESVVPYLMTLPFTGVVPRDVVEDVGPEAFNKAPVGSGPFTMADVDLDRGLVLTRFEDYWGEPAHLDRVEWTFGTDPEVVALRIQDGEVDMMQERLPSGVVQQVRDDPRFENQFVTGVVNDAKYFTLNVTTPELSDVRVRRAIAMALDKDRLVQVLLGLPEAATGGIFSPISPYFQDDLGHPFDPKQSKALLSEAGFADGLEIALLAQTETPFREMAEVAQANLADVGIRVRPSIVSANVFSEAAYSASPPAMIAYLWDLPYPHGSYIIDGAFGAAAIDALCCNLSQLDSGSLEELMRAAHATSDADELVSLYQDMDTLIVKDQVAAIPVFYDVRTELISQRVRGFEIPKTLSASHFFADYWIQDA